MKSINILCAGGLTLCLLLTLLCPSFARAEALEQQQSWAKRCSSDERAPGECEIFQRLVIKENGVRLIEFAVGYPLPGKPARGVIVLPLGIMLLDGVGIKIDDKQEFSFKVRYCTQEGCFAFITLDEPVLNLFKKGGQAVFSFKDLNGEQISIPMSLNGFTKALANLK